MVITYRKYEEQDLYFFQSCVKDSPEWQQEECTYEDIKNFMAFYEHLNGRWLVWIHDGQKIGLTFTVDQSPSNGRPWLGTVLVDSAYRRQKFGEKMINLLLEEWAENGHKVAYAAIPIMQHGWSAFLSMGGFEQYKIEKDKEHTYLLFVKPLEKE
jgi:GNAT superfamily N-acetyltransferase